MTIDLEEIKHLEELARIKLTDKEREKYGEQLSSILEYVNKLQEVDIKGVEATGHASEAKNIWREDTVNECAGEIKKRIMENAPELVKKLFKVKSVFEK